MDEEEGGFRLGELLCLLFSIHTSTRLISYMTHGYFNPWFLEETRVFLARALLERFPWLRGASLPRGIGENDWAMLWAWVDTLEIKHGAWHQVEPLTDAELAVLWPATKVTFEGEPPRLDGGLG